VQQQICNLVQVGGNQSANVLADVMIVDAAQLLYFKVVLGVTNCGNGLMERHATFDVVDHHGEVCPIWDVDHVHLVILIKLKEFHRVVFQRDILLCLLVDPFHVHVVVLLVLVVEFINVSDDLIIVTVKQLFDDDVDDRQ
jgi:hypothetical protein